MTHAQVAYRPDIDGLRAIAVLGVVLFHFGAHWLPGGFVGVDVFFVISGYVISKSMFREMESGSFSLVGFYERRARRILPALFVTVIASAVAAYFLLFPSQIVDFAKSAIAAVTSTSNMYFYLTADYFGPAADQIPLLHLWSLGVEEQFYFAFPLIMLAVFKYARSQVAAIVCVLAVSSLVFCEIVLRIDPPAAFYWLPFRAFELLIGVALALDKAPTVSRRWVAQAAGGTGLVLIVAGFLLITEADRFPGIAALVPAAGAALVIWSGTKRQTLVYSLLGLRPVVFFGGISYSLYLVHWPIFVFAKAARQDIPPILLLVGGVMASVILAWLSTRWVEKPFRSNKEAFPRKRVFQLASVGIVALTTVFLATVHFGASFGVSDQAKTILAYGSYNPGVQFREYRCFLRPEQAVSELVISECSPDTHPQVMIFGDSYGAQYQQGLAKALHARGYTLAQITASSCAPLLGIEMPERPNCAGLHKLALEQIEKVKPEIVLLAGGFPTSSDVIKLLENMITAVNQRGSKVVLLGPTPYYKRQVPFILADRVTAGDFSENSGADIIKEYTFDRDATLKAAFDGRPDVKYVSVLDAVCPNGSCPMALNGRPLHFDFSHFNELGSDYFASKVIDQILN